VGTAKAIAQIWGNMRTGIVEHGEYNGEMTQCESFATDLQNNFSFSDIFTAKHVRYSNNKGIEVLKKPDDISNAVKIQKSKSVRNSILSVIPDYVQDLVKKWCRQTMASEVKDVQEAFEGWIKLFAKAGVNADLLLRYVDVRTRKDLTAANIVDIRILFESIKEDPKVADKYFPGREKPKADAAGDSKVATEPPKSTKKTSASGSTQTQTSTASPSEQSTEPSAPQADAKKSAPATTTTEAPKSDSTSAEDTAASSQATPSAPASVTESKPTSNPKPAADANEQSDTSHSSASASESESSTEEQAADSAPAPSASGKAPIAFFRPRK
jgi:hypothetical protein